jgi:hypothetical protein
MNETELKSTLDALWELRGEKGNDWGDLVNMLQLTVWAAGNLSEEQCQAVRRVIKTLNTDVDLDDIVEAERRLSAAGLDPWACISRPDPTS